MPDTATDTIAVSNILDTLLTNRGITDLDEIDRFLHPDYETHLHDPFLMRGMSEAVDRILDAIDANEKILIYSDFDADGIPGAVVLHDFFTEIGYENFEHYIPHRHDEGFGVHLNAINQFAENGVQLIITIDCGISDVAEVRAAREHGIDVIVTDHHEPGDELPPANAVVDPKQTACEYPDANLCGAGVIFKVVLGVLAKRRFGMPRGREKWLLDMVGLATLSDMVPLVGENRVFARYGLVVLRKSGRPGLQKMLRTLRIMQPTISEDDIGFMIAPRINAASRMGVPTDAFTFLSTRDVAEADRAVKHLNEINDERKGTVASMVKAIKKRISEANHERREVPSVIVAGDPSWLPSLLGLAANTIATEYDRPVFLWGRDGRQQLKGSARSNGRVDLVKLMRATGDVLDQYGGHTFAGGFAVNHESVHLLEQALIDALAVVGEEEPDEDSDTVDAELHIDDVRDEACDEILKLAPFGIGNPKPLFRLRDIRVREARTFGKQNNHLEFTFQTSAGRPVKAIAFFKTPKDFHCDCVAGDQVTLTAHVERSYFRGRPELRLRIVDIE